MLWCNPNLPNFNTLPEPQVWAKYKITLISQVVENHSLWSLNYLYAPYNVPASYSFRDFQLFHAFGCQFPNASLRLNQSDWENFLWMECLEKPTLVLNNKLLLFFLPDLCDIQQKWLRDIPDLDDEDWEDVWDFPFRQLVSFRDTLTIQNIAQSLLHPIQTTQNGLIILPGVLAV